MASSCDGSIAGAGVLIASSCEASNVEGFSSVAPAAAGIPVLDEFGPAPRLKNACPSPAFGAGGSAPAMPVFEVDGPGVEGALMASSCDGSNTGALMESSCEASNAAAGSAGDMPVADVEAAGRSAGGMPVFAGEGADAAGRSPVGTPGFAVTGAEAAGRPEGIPV